MIRSCWNSRWIPFFCCMILLGGALGLIGALLKTDPPREEPKTVADPKLLEEIGAWQYERIEHAFKRTPGLDLVFDAAMRGDGKIDFAEFNTIEKFIEQSDLIRRRIDEQARAAGVKERLKAQGRKPFVFTKKQLEEQREEERRAPKKYEEN